MNYYGSYRKLLENSKSAILAAIEIYNKPKIEYRDECFIILFINSWELFFKALLSKHRKKIYYPKRQGESYRTLSLEDALTKATTYFPSDIPFLPVQKNILLLSTYRDNAIHFYNKQGFQSLIYSLSQTGIKNYLDLMKKVFDTDFENEINWKILPLGFQPPIDPVTFLQSTKNNESDDPAIREFLFELKSTIKNLQETNQDTGRLLTIFNVKLESVKKIDSADLIAGIQNSPPISSEGTIFVNKIVDPNVSHPLRQKDVLKKIENLHGIKFTSNIFQAIIQKYDLKKNPNLAWIANEGILTKYSNDIIKWIQRLTKQDIEQAKKEYNKHHTKKIHKP